MAPPQCPEWGLLGRVGPELLLAHKLTGVVLVCEHMASGVSRSWG